MRSEDRGKARDAVEPQGLYLYCFARAGVARHTEVAGVDERPGVTGLEVGKVAAVFSRVHLNDFSGEAAETRTQDPQWVVPRACRHEQVVQEMMRSGPVLPVRFGTVFSSEEALKGLLVQRSEEIALILDRLSDKEEWAVKGLVDAAKARAWLLATDPVLAECRRKLPESPGARYLHKKRLDAEADSALRLWSAAVAEQVQALCRSQVADLCPLRPQSRPVSGREADMVLNLAVLVRRGHVPALLGRLQELGATYADQGLTLEVSGPWPPYHFCPPPETRPDETPGLLHSA
jgi:hypothetical protein